MSQRTCVSCKTPLAEGVRFCPTCGSRQPEATAVPPTQVLPSVPPPPTGTPTQIVPPSAPASGTPTQIVPPTSPPGGTPTQALPPTSPPYGMPAQPLPPSSPPGGMPAQMPPAMPAAPAKKGGFPWLLLLLGVGGLCVIMAIVVVGILTLLGQRVSTVFSEINSGLAVATPAGGGGFGLPIDTPVAEETSAPVEERPTAEALPTRAGVAGLAATRIAAAQQEVAATEAVLATQSAVELEGAAATTQALENEAATAAVVATEQALTAGATQAFRDEFADNRNAWFTGRFNDNETNLIENGVFRVLRDTRGSSFELYQPRPFSNFVAEVDCLVVAGSSRASCGLVFGEEENVGRFSFEVFNDYYRLSINQGGEWTVLLEGNPEGILKPEAWNTLSVVRRGNDIRLSINGQFLQSAVDDRFPTGRIGVETSSYQEEGDGQFELQFDNFTIWELPT